MPQGSRPGDVLAGRYRLVDLLTESGGGRFWRAHDRVLERHVALHVIPEDDPRAEGLMVAARRSAAVLDPHLLRVLDADVAGGQCYVVNEWGWGTSLDIVVAGNGPLGPRRAAWLVSEVASAIAVAHATGVSHGRLVPENVLIDRSGGVRIIGLSVDAALHGLPDSAIGTDVRDLAGLLYCLITTTWAGPSTSIVAPAPREHGIILRPRRVRAGVPRVLDVLCDEVLICRTAASTDAGQTRDTDDTDDTGPGGLGGSGGLGTLAGLPGLSGLSGLGSLTGLTGGTSSARAGLGTARAVADYLADFVGDPLGMPEALIASTPDVLPEEELITLPPVPEMTVRAEDPPLAPLEPEDTPDSRVQARVEDLPTEAGLPIFGEDDDVSWLQKSTEPVTPPPPFEEPPERPLFAPAPAAGEPVRRPRTPTATASTATTSATSTGEGFWPFDVAATAATDGATTRPGAGTGTTGTTETGGSRRPRRRAADRPVSAVFPPHPADQTDARDPGTGADRALPGRRFLRLAGAIAVVSLLVVAVIVAVTLGRGTTPSGAEPTPGPSSPITETAAGTVLGGLDASVVDPQGDGLENDSDAALAVDGTASTAWPTSTYDEQFGARPAKGGVGLVVDLGAQHTVTGVDLALVGSPTTVTVYLSTAPVQRVAGLTRLATRTAHGATLDLQVPAARGRYLVVWLTRLPSVGNRFRGGLAEVAVRGS